MKAVRILLTIALTALVSTLAMAAQPPEDGKTAFADLKALGGLWEGPVTTTPPQAEVEGQLATVSLRVTSRGHALMHDMKMEGIPDNPITMFYVDEGSLLLTHYCDAGNRPRMQGRAAADGKTIEFELLDLTGGDHHGHMHRAQFTLVDADHHVEEWTYMLPNGQPVRARLDLRRVQ
ncbi:MAG TPA: hypothetical protein VMS86_12095 [Thermoanaerobaculia bacterium]|nr:hypothetical protein [Thermoanaerobaculia bacterium]